MTPEEELNAQETNPVSLKEDEDEFLDFQTPLDLISSVVSVLLYLFDVATDVYIAAVYYNRGWWTYFLLTITFLIVPSVFTAIWEYTRSNQLNKDGTPKEPDKNSLSAITVIILKSIIQWPGLSVNLQYLWFSLVGYYKWKRFYIKDRKAYTIKINWLLGQICIFGLIDGLVEGVPQIMLQVFIFTKKIWMDEGPNGRQVSIGIIQAIVSSIVSCAWAICFAYLSFVSGSPLVQKQIQSMKSVGLLFLVYLFMMGSRFICLVQLGSMSHLALGLFLAGHWLSMFIWSLIAEMYLNNWRIRRTYSQLFGSLLLSISYVFVYVIIHQEKISRKFWIVSGIYFIQNFIICFCWYALSVNFDLWDGIAIIVPNVLLALGLILMCFHGDKYRGEDIQSVDKKSAGYKYYQSITKSMGYIDFEADPNEAIE